MPVYHSKKHDINDDKSHIKNELDLNDYLSLKENKFIWLGSQGALTPSNMDDWTDSLTGWTGTGMSLDSSDKIEGNNSLKLQASGNATYTRTFSPAIDLTNATVFHMWTKKVTKNATVNYIRFLAPDSSNYYDYAINTTYEGYDWMETAMQKSFFTAVGSPNWNNVTALEINQTNSSSPYCVVKWDKFYWSGGKGIVGNANTDDISISGNMSISGYIKGVFVGDGQYLENVIPDMDTDDWFWMNTSDTAGIRFSDNPTNHFETTTTPFDMKGQVGVPSNQGINFDGYNNGKAYAYYDTSGAYNIFVISTEDINDQLYLYGEGASGTNGVYIESGNDGIEMSADFLQLTSMPLRLQDGQYAYFDTAHAHGIKWDNTDKELQANSAVRIGDATNSANFAFDGSMTFEGTARKWKESYTYAYNLYGNAATYNSISCNAAGSSVVSNKWYMKTFSDGSGFGEGPEAAIVTMKMPLEYEDGTDFKVHVHWTSNSTSGNIVYGIGVLAVGNSDNYAGTETYHTGTIAAPSSSYNLQEIEATFSGTGVKADDDVAIVVYRDCDDASDTMSGDALVSTVSLKYVAGRWGE